MDIKRHVAAALEGKTPDQKITIACRVLNKDIALYAHLDNGRKSMTAGNLLRTACAKDEALVEVMEDCAASIEDVTIDAAGYVPAEKDPMDTKSYYDTPVSESCHIGSQPFSGVVLPKGEHMVRSGNAWICINSKRG